MNEAEKLKEQLKTLKAEAESLLAENKVQEAENKTIEIKILSAKIEIQEKLDIANTTIENLKNDITAKDEEIKNLKADLETANSEKDSAIEKFNNATNTVAELNAKVKEMQPIVDKYNEEKREKELKDAIDNYRTKFEKVDGLEMFETEEVQNLIADTISEDSEVSNKAKYALSDKLFELIDKQDASNVNITDIQEPSKETKNLNVEDDEFEAVYGFKKE